MNEQTNKKVAGLALEIGKKQPFAELSEEAFLNVLRTNSVLTNRMSRWMRQWDLTDPGYNILRILRGAGDEGRCPSEIVSHMIAAVPDMTRLIDRLEKRGLIERRRVDTDRRMVRVFIRPEGLALLEELDAPLRTEVRQLFSSLTDAELRTLSDLLFRVRQGAKTSGVV